MSIHKHPRTSNGIWIVFLKFNSTHMLNIYTQFIRQYKNIVQMDNKHKTINYLWLGISNIDYIRPLYIKTIGITKNIYLIKGNIFKRPRRIRALYVVLPKWKGKSKFWGLKRVHLMVDALILILSNGDSCVEI